MTTFTAAGLPKGTGGDSWEVVLHDPGQCLRVPTRVFDLGNGTYTVAFLSHFPGTFTMVGRLGYSECRAALDPPGDAEREALSEADSCYIGSKIVLPAAVTVGPAFAPDSCMVSPAVATQSGVPPPWNPGAVRGEEAAVRQGGINFLPCCNKHLKALGRQPGRGLQAPAGGTRRDPGTRGDAVRSRRNSGGPAGETPFPQRPRVSRLLLWGDSTTKRQWLMLMMLARQHCKIEWVPRLFEEQYVPEACRSVPSDQYADPELEALLYNVTGGVPWTDIPIATNTIEVSRYFPDSGLVNLSNASFWDAVLLGGSRTVSGLRSAEDDPDGDEPARRRRTTLVRSKWPHNFAVWFA